jgi:hypothetical protein
MKFSTLNLKENNARIETSPPVYSRRIQDQYLKSPSSRPELKKLSPVVGRATGHSGQGFTPIFYMVG